MLKSEMNEIQLEKRELFISQLLAAGWNAEGWEMLFESGVNVTPEAQAEYQNADFEMRVSYYASEDYIFLECMGRDGRTLLSLRFYPQGSLGAIVDMIIEAQNSLSIENSADFVKRMLLACDHVLFETPEGSLQLH